MALISLTRTFLIAWCLLTLGHSACTKQPISVADQIQAASIVYYGGDWMRAEQAIEKLIEQLEDYRKKPRLSRAVDYDAILGMQWLRLWSVCAENDQSKAAMAMAAAMRYFDLDPVFIKDPDYLRDKPGALAKFLEFSEKADRPRWKNDKRPSGVPATLRK